MQPRHRYLISRSAIFGLLLLSAAAAAVNVAGNVAGPTPQIADLGNQEDQRPLIADTRSD